MVLVACEPTIQCIFDLLEANRIEGAEVNVHHLADAVLGRYDGRSLLSGMDISSSRKARPRGSRSRKDPVDCERCK